jgi:UDP-glucose 4-epimerase
MGLNVLVTGGAGYIGSTTAAHLLQQGRRVTIVDNLSRGHQQAVPERAQSIVGDIGDVAVLVASSEEIRRGLGWEPRCSELPEMIQSAWDWHRMHPQG